MPKRVLSHTTLERKIRLIFGLMILLVIVASFFFPWYQMESQITEQDLISAREMVRPAFQALHMVPGSPKLKAEWPTLAKVGPPSARPDAEPPRVILPEAPEDRPERRPRDSREQQWLAQFAANLEITDKHVRERREDGYHLRYAYPLRAREGCIDCHRAAKADLKGGDLMGAIVISFPVERTRTLIKYNRAILIGAALVTALVSMILFYAVVRLVIVQPVKHLKQVADRVTDGDLDVRADLQTGDEFEGLSRSFNRMLQRLEASREELRRANVSLDRKLEELARANVSLFEMNQVKSKFLTTMSHELRTPLNAIIGFADLLEESSAARGDVRLGRYVDNIRNSGRLLLDIINDLLDLAKIEAGKMALMLEQVSPLDVAETAMNMVRPLVGQKDLRLELEVADTCPIMTTDAGKLQQVLYNLLSNAVKFTPTGSVRLAVRPLDAETMLFQASDSGPGLSAEQQKLVFDRFSQVDSGHTRQHGGTGLGLSIVRELVELLGGNVAVQSELGRGATFNVTLPIVASPAREEPGGARVTKVETQAQPKEPSEEKAPEPVTPEDTVLAVDVEADALKPDEDDTADEPHPSDR